MVQLIFCVPHDIHSGNLCPEDKKRILNLRNFILGFGKPTIYGVATQLFFRKGLGPVKAPFAVHSGPPNLLGDLQLFKYWSNTHAIL